MGQQISLRLPEQLVREIDREAGRRRKTRSELVREVLERHIRNGAREEPPWSRVEDLVGSLAGGPRDLGARHRAYLVRAIRGGRR